MRPSLAPGPPKACRPSLPTARSCLPEGRAADEIPAKRLVTNAPVERPDPGVREQTAGPRPRLAAGAGRAGPGLRRQPAGVVRDVAPCRSHDGGPGGVPEEAG